MLSGLLVDFRPGGGTDAIARVLADMGLSVGFATGAQLGEREKTYRASWTRTIHTSGFKPL